MDGVTEARRKRRATVALIRVIKEETKKAQAE